MAIWRLKKALGLVHNALVIATEIDANRGVPLEAIIPVTPSDDERFSGSTCVDRPLLGIADHCGKPPDIPVPVVLQYEGAKGSHPIVESCGTQTCDRLHLPPPSSCVYATPKVPYKYHSHNHLEELSDTVQEACNFGVDQTSTCEHHGVIVMNSDFECDLLASSRAGASSKAAKVLALPDF